MDKQGKSMNSQDKESADSDFSLFHLKEAIEGLECVILALESKSARIDDPIPSAFLAHAYEHMNWCWNGRNRSDRASTELSGEEFSRFSRFPADIDDLMTMKWFSGE
ncbi:MAG: hypothetical protein IT203_08780 [Fimbriimonadaceae bacterium]|nr:hypothetical protein [Fimbriimonadaceae bacterium]